MTLKNSWKKSLTIFVLCLLLAIPATMFVASSINASSTHKIVKKVTKKASAKNTKKVKAILQASTFKKIIYAKFSKGFVQYIRCVGPDGKTAYAPKVDCDAVIAFWASHKPSNPAPSSSSGSNNSGDNNSGSNNSSSNSSNNTNNGTPTPTVTPTPTDIPNPISIRNIVQAACTSSSCQDWLTTLIVTGVNFTPTSRVSLKANGITYDITSPNVQYVGGNGSTEIITDFQYLPKCTTFDVTVSDSSTPSFNTWVNGFTSACK